MKRILLVLTGLMMTGLAIGQTMGGPDAYGYIWRNSDDPSGPVFNWIDITTIGTPVTGLADDNSAPSMISFGFTFHYYWGDYSKVKVGSNGWASFDNISNIASCFPTIPSPGSGGDNVLAALMGDLNFTGALNPGEVYYYTNSIDTFILEYVNVPYWSAAAPGYVGSNTFEIILNANDSSITYQYLDQTGFTTGVGCNAMTVGIENSTGSIGLQNYSNAIPPDTFAIKYYYPPVPLISVKDVKPDWNENNENKGFFTNIGNYDLKTNIKNVGNSDVTTTIDITAQIQDLLSTPLFTANSSFTGLIAGDDTLITHSPSSNITVPGQYIRYTLITNSEDINPGNNSQTTEIDFVDLCQPTAQLTYYTGNPPDGTINWSGGAWDDGVGTYYAPPIYPVDIDSLEYYISTNTSDGFIAAIYDDDGLAGAPGTLLFSDTIQSTSVISGGWNTVVLPSSINITSGGFYVAYYQGGGTIFLGLESASPWSRQNYEILDGSWAEFRYNNINDLGIRANVSLPSAGAPAADFDFFVTDLNVVFADSTGGSGYTYFWDFGDGDTSVLQNPTHNFDSCGTYNVCLTASTGCNDSTFCQSVSVSTPVNNGTTVLGNNITASQTGATYQWLDCDNNYAIIPGETNQGFGFTVNGSYAVQVNYLGCVDTSACVQTSLGVNEVTPTKLKVYPNPAQESIQIDLNGTNVNGNTVKIQLMDISGKVIELPFTIHNNILNVELGTLPKGMYLFQVFDQGKRIGTGNFIKS